MTPQYIYKELSTLDSKGRSEWMAEWLLLADAEPQRTSTEEDS